MKINPQFNDLETKQMEGYTLLDSGNGRKLELFGSIVLDRPEERAVWKTALSPSEWHQANAIYQEAAEGGGGKWQVLKAFETPFAVTYKGLTYQLEVDQSKQVGVFPENAVHWDWIQELIRNAEREVNVLNLFGYTGLASLAAAKAGASVTHVDASKRAIRTGQHSQQLSGLGEASIRWMVDDALKFVEREIRRGVKYDGILMDPPKYGLGPKKERWEFERLFTSLCNACREVLSPSPLFIVVTAYSIQSTADRLIPDVSSMLEKHQGTLEIGDLVLVEQSAGRKIPVSIYARWQNNK